ncbi:MAG: hypothetical protein GWP18_00590 [Proteobacteria bacterium]|nr:hypothetical protein [Pseudomonadota bacterium]
MAARSHETEILFFTAPHCSVCRAVRPTATEVAESFEGTVTFREIDATQHPDIAASYAIKGVPTIVAIHNDEIVGRYVGSRSKPDIVSLFESAKSGDRTHPSISPTDRGLRLSVAAVFAVAALLLGQPLLWVPAVGAASFGLWDLIRS